MISAEEKRMLAAEVQSLENERIIEAIRELLAFGKKYADEKENDSAVKEPGSNYDIDKSRPEDNR